MKGDILIGSAPKHGNSYMLNMTQPSTKVAVQIQQNKRALVASLSYNDEAVELWHRRMGHLNEEDLKRLAGMSNGMTLSTKPRMKSICDACSMAKSKRKPSRTIQKEVFEKLGKIHTDLGGPINIPSVGGSKYYILITD